ncbi:MAG: putative ATP-binding cassette sub-family C member Sur, partial [Streblomastix strix]
MSSTDPDEEEEVEVKRPKNLEESHWFLCNLFYCFFMPFVCRVKHVTEEDIWPVEDKYTCELQTQRGYAGWGPKYAKYLDEVAEYERNKGHPTPDGKPLKEPKKPSLYLLILTDIGGWPLFLAAFLQFLSAGFSITVPSMMKGLLKAAAVKDTPESTGFPYVYAILLMVSPFLLAINSSFSQRLMLHFTNNVRSALVGLIYRKIMLLNITSQSNIDTGRILSLLSSDTGQLSSMFPMFFSLSVLPFEIFVPFGFVTYYWGVASLLAFVVIVISLPLQMWISTFLFKAVNMYYLHNDERNKVTNETLSGMRVVKLSGLETVFLERIESIREKQLVDIYKFTFTMQLMMSIMLATPIFVTSISMTMYVFTKDVEEKDFPVQVMSCVGYLFMMTQPFNSVAGYIQSAGMVFVAHSRVRDFLTLPEIKKIPPGVPEDPNIDVEIKDASFKWGDPPEIPLTEDEKLRLQLQAKRLLAEAKKEQDEEVKEILKEDQGKDVEMQGGSGETVPQVEQTADEGGTARTTKSAKEDKEEEAEEGADTPPLLSPRQKKKKEKGPYLKHINLVLPKGSLTMVIGAVGSGKSSIGSILIGDIEKVEGDVKVRGQIAYNPQTPWINNNTVRGNITFGMKYNKKKYQHIVKVCALETDFKLFAAGDQTAIGEKGVNLSGGQKARIQLARSVYSDRDILVLDDPLSAVDAHVGKTLFEDCINGYLKGKTRLLMTNQLQFIDKADNIVMMKDGQIEHQGSMEELNKQGINFDKFLIKGNKKAEKKKEEAALRQRNLFVSLVEKAKREADSYINRQLQGKGRTTGPTASAPKARATRAQAPQETPRGKNKFKQVVRQQVIPQLPGHKQKKNAFADVAFNAMLRSQMKKVQANALMGIAQAGNMSKVSKDDELNSVVQSDMVNDILQQTDKEAQRKQSMTIKKMQAAVSAARNASRMISAVHNETGTVLEENEDDKQVQKAPEGETQGEEKKKDTSAAKQIITKEEQETGSIPMSSYFTYLFSLLPAWAIVPGLLLVVLAEGVFAFAQFWLGTIGGGQFGGVPYKWKIYTSIFIAVASLGIYIVRGVFSSMAVRRSTKEVHRTLLTHVMNAPSSFFDSTPLGRILNRFTSDVSGTDMALFSAFMTVIQMWLGLLMQIIVISIDTVWFLLIGIPTLIVFYIIMLIYSRASRNLTRLAAMSSSPIISHFSETVSGAGLSTIRAYHLEEQWKKRFADLNDEASTRGMICAEGRLWASLYASLVSSIFMVAVVLIGWITMNAAKLSVAITSAQIFANLGTMIIFQNVALQSIMTSYGRIRTYSKKLPQEVSRSEINPVDPPKNWPQKGQIEFEKVTFRYRSGLPFVLKDVSFNLNGGEKIGVCGRTGAGKSSILFALFRLVELDVKLQPKMIDMKTGFLIDNDANEDPNKGIVRIDGIDISKVEMSKVRRSIAIIPQDPTLFTGTLRYNLDIAGVRSDEEIWNVLGLVEMINVIQELPMGLDTQVAEGGSNFSTGQ